jgi:phosphoglucosamine mutase
MMDAALGEGLAEADKLGRVKRIDDAQARYVEIAKASFPRTLSLSGLRVVIDCANGAAYNVAPTALYELGAEVFPIGVDPNGLNINADCGSTHPAALSDAVRLHRADIGIALDGDADRIIICDEKGQVVDGDQIMALVALDWAQRGLLVGGGVVATVMSNLGLERALAAAGLTLERTRVGDRYVMERMKSGGFNLGGEQSGHIILHDHATTGDGLMSALQVLAVLVASGRKMSDLARQFVPVPQKLVNVRYAAGKPLEKAEVKAAIAEAEAALTAAGGRLLVRPSGTERLIRVMAEGDDEALVAWMVEMVAAAVKAAG